MKYVGYYDGNDGQEAGKNGERFYQLQQPRISILLYIGDSPDHTPSPHLSVAEQPFPVNQGLGVHTGRTKAPFYVYL